MQFTFALLTLTTCICVCVTVLALWPSQLGALLYLWTIPAGLMPFFRRGREPHASYVKGVSRRWSIAVVLSLMMAGVPAFIGYWVTGSHHIALELNWAFICVPLLLFVAAGGRFR